MGAVEPAAKCPERIAAIGTFDLDDIGAHIGQHHARSRPGDERAHFEHGDIGKRLGHIDIS